jgi:hypothetical protein
MITYKAIIRKKRTNTEGRVNIMIMITRNRESFYLPTKH